jgi:hypothetical protein
MAAYYKVDVSLSTNSVTVGAPSPQEVLVTLPLVGPAGPQGPQGPAGAGAVESVNGETGIVVLDASDVGAIAASILTTQGDIVVRGASAPQRLALGNGAGKPLVVGASGPEWSVADSNFVLSQSVKISNAGTTEVNGVYLPTDSINGKASYIKDDYTISWDGASWNISANTTDYYTSSNDTSYPWQATTWTVDSGASPYPDVEQAAFSDMESVLGSKSYNTRTPSSTLAHASSHHTGGLDSIAPNNIGAAWTQIASTQGITGDTVLTAGRNLRISVASTSTITANITLPFTGNQAGDIITLVAVSVGPPFTSTYTIRLAGQFDGGGNPVGYSNLATINALGQSFTFVSDGSASGWSLRSVDTHTHAASAITGGTLDVARLPVGTGSTNVIAPTIIDAKGDLIVGSAADTVARLPVGGTNGHVLTVDSAETLGLKYAALPAELVIACSDETSNLTTGTAKVTFRMPYAMTLSSVRASVNTAPTGSTLIVDINEAGSTILSTKLSIDASELTSTTAATAAVISDTALADDAEVTIDIDQIGSTIAGKGLKAVLKGVRA